MLVYIYFEKNDGEFEFEATVSGHDESYGYGSHMDFHDYSPAFVEFEDYGMFSDMVEAVTVAAWVVNCPMSVEEIKQLATKVEEDHKLKFLENL